MKRKIIRPLKASTAVIAFALVASNLLVGCGNFQANSRMNKVGSLNEPQGPAPTKEQLSHLESILNQSDLEPTHDHAPGPTTRKTEAPPTPSVPEDSGHTTSPPATTENPTTPVQPDDEKPKTTPPQEPKPYDRAESPADARFVGYWDKEVSDGRAWTGVTAKAIDSYGQQLLEIVPKDVERFCKRYPELSATTRKAFWIRVISALAAAESSFDPESHTKVSIYGSTKPSKLARGLLQLSFDSTKAYSCEFQDWQQVHDPRLNLECGVRIMNWWMIRDGRIAGRNDKTWLGLARYWSPMRTNNKMSEVIRKSVAKLPYCN